MLLFYVPALSVPKKKHPWGTQAFCLFISFIISQVLEYSHRAKCSNIIWCICVLVYISSFMLSVY